MQRARNPQWMDRHGDRLALAGVLVFTLVALPRAALPVDETRYLAVAWEMWSGGSWLVPLLNGTPYADKPPLLFWLIHAGWLVAGVGDLWPRMVPALAATGCILLTRKLAQGLWPERPEVASRAPLLLCIHPLWSYFVPAVMFDMLLGFSALLAWLGIVAAWRGDARGFLWLGLGVGLGLLTKGPAILLHVLPAAVTVSWWGGPSRRPGREWATGTALAVLAGSCAALAWAWPAGVAGGEAYRNAILWGQTTGRVVSSFAHEEPFWFYAAMAPVLALPWIAWPALWRAARASALRESGTRFCVAQGGAALVAFSCISGKQTQYLLPELALMALWVARHAPATAALRRWAFASFAACLALQLGASALPRLGYDVRPLARRLGTLERAEAPLANVGKYRGQFHFYGRLERPVSRVRKRNLESWLGEDPRGRAVVYFSEPPYAGPGRVEHQQRYRGQWAAIVSSE